MADKETALIVGAGQGLSASLARLFASEGMDVAIAARNTDKLSGLCEETGARAYACDAVDAGQVDALFAAVTADISEPDVVVYNASNRARGPVQELDPEAVRTAIEISCFGGFLVAQAAAKLKSALAKPESALGQARAEARALTARHTEAEYFRVFDAFLQRVAAEPSLSAERLAKRPFYFSDRLPFGLMTRLWPSGCTRRND